MALLFFLEHHWFFIFISIYIIIALSMVISLLLYGVRPSKTLAWLLTIFTIPVGGMLLYIMLGRNKRRKKLKSHGFRVTTSHNDDSIRIPDPDNNALAKLIYKNSGFVPHTNTPVTLLKDGQMTFDAIFEALMQAQNYIHVQYYIFEEGILASKLLEVFQQKINEGVSIRLIYDGIGSFTLSRSYLRKLNKIGVKSYSFLPFRLGRFLSGVNYRNHRKIIVVDGHTAFTGGINISDKYIKGDPLLGKWHDMHLKIEGKPALDLNRVFEKDWLLSSGEIIAQKTIFEPMKEPNGHCVQIVSSGPEDDFAAIEQVYFKMIMNAKDYVYIINPYIIPNAALHQALNTAALSGVEVRLLISEKTDSKLVGLCVRAYFESYLKSGVRIFLYPEGFLHSKIIISDDKVASIGTANLDERSFQQNYEVNAMVYSNQLALELKKDFLEDCSVAKELNYTEFVKRPAIEKLKEGTAKILSPLL